MKVYTRMAPWLAVLTTFAYCWAIWWFSGLFGTLVPYEIGSYETTMLSVVLVAPIPDTFWLHAIHWQIIACVSLILALWTASNNKDEIASNASYSLPLLCHAFYLMSISFLHGIGLLASIIAFAYKIE